MRRWPAASAAQIVSFGLAALAARGVRRWIAGRVRLTGTGRGGVLRPGRGRRQGRRSAVTIGTANFSIPGDEMKTVKLDIDAAGRALLNADHGRVNTSLAIFELAPNSESIRTKAVHLVQQIGAEPSRTAMVGIRYYHCGVAVQKLSIALEEPVVQAARKAAERRGISLSAWLNLASVNALAVEDGLMGVAEWEAEHGRPSQDQLAAADAVLDAASIGRGHGQHQAT